jgi:cell shape-determining protein MreD
MKISSLRWLYPLFILSIFIFFIPTQTLLLETIKIGSVKPDLGLILSYLVGLGWGRNRGLFWGLLFGGFQDFFSMGSMGPHLFLKGLIGFGTGLLETFFLYFSLQAHAIVVFLISLMHDFLGEIFFHGTDGGLVGISYGMLGRGIYNSAIVIAILFIVLRQSLLTDFLMDRGSR